MPPTDAPHVLRLRGLTKRFGPVLANDSIDLDLRRGEILALLGENGAGKTTLMNMLFGHYLPDSGAIEVADGADGALRPLPLGRPQAALRAGVGMVHQHFTLALNLSALDNILLGAEPLFALRRRTGAARRKIDAIMARTGLNVDLDAPVGRLTVGERQRVEILKALYRDARILVLDEPTAVLTPQEADGLFQTLGAMAREGLSVIFISHKLREVLAFSHRIAVLRHGRKVGEMRTDEADLPAIARMMVGQDVESPPRPPMTPGEPVLELREVTLAGAGGRAGLRGASLRVHAREIVGVAGVSGNGQAALAALVSGLAAPEKGELLLRGAAPARFDPAAMIAAGVGRIPEDRHHDGVVGSMTLAENLIIERLDDPAVSRAGFLRRGRIRAEAERACAAYDVRGQGPDGAARLLSGGNMQKLILARVFERAPDLILANQPTRGLDLGAANEVARRLLEARARGAGVLLISEDLDEILALSDRVVVMHEGRLTEAPARDRAQIGLMMAGRGAEEAA
ncbi:ABC transporter ATP-binding protein [Oceanicella actignis]|uniref:Simple sugar transport system ATP-binding protein n=1 Tax=Oceanicella actignis TaxID=1189325 RepID=A0A1M7SU73_9RHOB|nr:ABC transporter ATP-binding protein [Oceanicella actignis]SES70865.1 nucleoside ABC transporter ATP-binding protein [Oceanicella actignis]SHN62001.1 simple sugar transport system ATP-binding protein [Oceanicella actignis]